MKKMLNVATPTDREIVMTRSFDAPRDMVWRAMTSPEIVRKWLFAPPGWKMTVCENDLRVGGSFRWEWADQDGKTALVIRGVNKDVTAPARLVHTELMEMPGMGCAGGGGEGGSNDWELLATLELVEERGVTTMRMTLLFPNKQARDGALASGMEHGMSAGYENLDRMLQETPANR